MDYKEEVIELCQKLVQQRSYSGEEKGVSDVLKEYMLTHGFHDVYIDDYGNTIGHIKGKREGKIILFDGHMDTVPVTNEEEWLYPPFSGEIHDDKIYGRGTSDMKGALAAMTVACSQFAKECYYDFPGDIYVAGIVHEECFEGVAARLVSDYVKPDYVIIGEASELNLKIGQRGRAEIVVETFGKSAHSANPEKGVNAVYKMADVIQAISHIEPPQHPILGKGILELTDIHSTPYPGASVVPNYCKVTYDRRLLVGETKESVLDPLNILVEKMKKEDPSLDVKISYAIGKEKCYTNHIIEGERFFPGWLFDENSPFIQNVYYQLKDDGYTPQITQYNFCTNGSHYAGEAGIMTIGLGPSYEYLAHTLNEYIEIDQLTKAVLCYLSVLKVL